MDFSELHDQFQRQRWEAVEAHGSLVPDMALAYNRCTTCGTDATRTLTFSEARWNSLQDLKERLPRLIHSTVTSQTCERCSTPVNGPEISAVWARWLPRAQQDLVLDLVIQDGTAKRWELKSGPPDGPWKDIKWETSEAKFHKRFGCYFSVRQVWRDLLASGKESFTQIEPDYFIAVFPGPGPDARDGELEAAQKKVVAFAKERGNLDAIIDLTAPDRLDTPEVEGYKEWLDVRQEDIQSGRILAYALASTQTYLDLLATEADRRGITVVGPIVNPQFPRLRRRPFLLEVPAFPSLAQGLPAGLSLHGCLQGLVPQLELLRNSQRVLRQLQAMVSPFEVQVDEEERRLLISRKNARKPEREFRVSELVGEDLEAFVRDVLQFDAKKRKFLAADVKKGT